MSEVLRATYHEELDALEAAFQEEGSLVLRALRGTINALEQQDTELADEVIAFDDEIDARYHDIERKIELLLARQTPVASELRLVLAILHNNIHLERMGDQCVTIAKLTNLSAQLHQEPRLVEGLEEMGSRAEEMTRLALEAFSARDLEQARSLSDLDELIDRTNRRIVEHVMQLAGDPSMQEWGMRMIIVSRCLERIGDNAVNIGEQTAYLVTGEFREFTDASHRAPGEV
jgi:phosphate transport system protein